jgi:mannose-6-phosphate isomerase
LDVANPEQVPETGRAGTVASMRRLEGVVQHYDWGDPAFIPRLLGVEPDGRPWAEWWLGTHPSGPSTIAGDGALADVAGPLPYLLKVLAATEPLSLQCHPSAEQAVDGHRRGIYPDDRPKPELLVALTPFEALCGVRPVEPTLELLRLLDLPELEAAVRSVGPGGAIAGLSRGTLDADAVVGACASADTPEAHLVTSLAGRYPGEPSVAVTLLLNHVRLDPGQAVRLGPGTLHAYLGGAGVELMGASDNVVRAGLTRKAVDVDELLRILDPTPMPDPVLAARDRYELPDAGVSLVRVPAGARHRSTGAEIAVSLDGTAWFVPSGDEFRAPADSYVVVLDGGRPPGDVGESALR